MGSIFKIVCKVSDFLPINSKKQPIFTNKVRIKVSMSTHLEP